MKKKFIDILKLLRVYQWHKNIIVFAPIFFSAQISYSNLHNLALGFVIFCVTASGVYIVNDILDKKKDQKHFKKKFRPIASGIISDKFALAVLIFLIFISIIFLLILKPNHEVTISLIFYFLINMLYSFGLKKVAILEIFLVSSGFIIRLIFGAAIIGVSLSNWIIVSIGLLSFLLVVGKRKSDLMSDQNQVSPYSGYFLDLLSCCISGVVITSYLLFCLSDYAKKQFGEYTIISSIFVIYAVFYYLKIILMNKNTDDPSEIVIKDPNIFLSIFFWVLFFIYSIYF
jgi:4-hydroxybenzoate polyprenyltransferase